MPQSFDSALLLQLVGSHNRHFNINGNGDSYHNAYRQQYRQRDRHSVDHNEYERNGNREQKHERNGEQQSDKYIGQWSHRKIAWQRSEPSLHFGPVMAKDKVDIEYSTCSMFFRSAVSKFENWPCAGPT